MRSGIAIALAAITVFCASFKGAYDLWASLLFTLAVLAVFSIVLIRSAWTDEALAKFPWVPIGIAATGLSASLASPVVPFDAWTLYPTWAAALLVFPIAVYAFKREADFDSFLRLLIPFFIVQGVLVIREQALGGFIDQSSGLLYDANAAAAFQVAWIPVFADRIRRSENSTVWKIGLIAAFAGFAGAKSVWGWMALAAMLPFFFPKKISRGQTAVISLLLVVGVIWKFSGSSDRLAWWATGLRMFADNPFTGVGLGGYSGAFLAYRVGDGLHTVSPHSVVIQLLSEFGMIGFGAICWAAATLVRERASDIHLRPGPALGAGALLLFSLISVCFEIPVNLLSFSLLAGAACAGGSFKSAAVPKTAAVAVGALSLCLSPFLIAPWQASRLVIAGQAALSAGEPENAAQLFEDASSLDSRSFESRRWEARTAFVVEGAEEAVALQRDAIARNRLNGVLWMELAHYLSEAELTAESVKAKERAHQLSAGLLK